MIKKLRLKLVLVVMLSLLIVLTVIVGAANLMSYNSILQEADETLDFLDNNDGSFPAEPIDPAPAPPADEDSTDNQPENIRNPLDSPEAPFSTRFFIVTLAPSGQALYNLTHIAAIDTESAGILASEAINSGKDYGFIGNYRFKVSFVENDTRVVFLDTTRELFTYRNFLILSISISLIAYAAVILLIFLLSNKIVKPFIENHEKQKRFITDAGHDIKTPLTIIDADAELLDIEYPNSEWVADIKKQTKRLATLTSDLIYLARMEEGLLSSMSEIPISRIVSEEAQSFSALAAADGKKFTQSVTPNLSLLANESDIRRLVIILLDNSFKYSGEGGEVSLSLLKTARHIHLEAKNTATNLSDVAIEHLFERFWRADSARNSKGGFGIGLSIARAITEAHGGRISARREDDKIAITVSFAI